MKKLFMVMLLSLSPLTAMDNKDNPDFIDRIKATLDELLDALKPKFTGKPLISQQSNGQTPLPEVTPGNPDCQQQTTPTPQSTKPATPDVLDLLKASFNRIGRSSEQTAAIAENQQTDSALQLGSDELTKCTQIIERYLRKHHEEHVRKSAEIKKYQEHLNSNGGVNIVETYINFIARLKNEIKTNNKSVNNKIGFKKSVGLLTKKELTEPYNPEIDPEVWLVKRSPSEIAYMSKCLLLTGKPSFNEEDLE